MLLRSFKHRSVHILPTTGALSNNNNNNNDSAHFTHCMRSTHLLTILSQAALSEADCTASRSDRLMHCKSFLTTSIHLRRGRPWGRRMSVAPSRSLQYELSVSIGRRHERKHTSWLPTDRVGDLLSYPLNTAGLNQHLSFPICISKGNLKSCLDVVISNVPEEDLSVTSYPPVGASDHVLVGGHVSLACPPQAPAIQQHVETWRWNWNPDRVVALK